MEYMLGHGARVDLGSEIGELEGWPSDWVLFKYFYNSNHALRGLTGKADCSLSSRFIRRIR